MGGYGSGRRGPRPDARPVVEHALRLDVDAFRRAGVPLAAPLEPGADGRRASLTIAATLSGRDIGGRWLAAPLWPADLDAADDGAGLAGLDAPDGAAVAVDLARLDADGAPIAPLYRVGLEWRRVGYGWRPFFACPWCDALARFAYCTGRGLWTCRDCAGLAYRSTRQADYARHESTLRRAAAALGARDAWTCDRGALYGAPDVLRRPLGMRAATYRRRLERYQDARATFCAAFALELARGWGCRALGPCRAPGSDAARRDALTVWRANGGRRLARIYGQRRDAAA